jgi:hypothetical protein
MPRKIDKRLQEAVQKGFENKVRKQRKEADAARAKREAHEKSLKKYLPKARAWVKEKLFKEIAKQEASGYSCLSLDANTDGIPTEVIYNLVKKIEGLQISCTEKVIWEDSDYGKVRGLVYTIVWKSVDPNLNRDY